LNVVTAEISFDLVMEDNMPFVEGCYRLEGHAWEVFTFIKSGGYHQPGIRKHVTWASGVTGINVVVPDDARLDKPSVLAALSDAFAVTEWSEVRGPDSMNLR
jgi:hypothetical protein